mmetsp:Transcript_31524/g.86817  ORF Transcript_31524/g.86817 Transcript_31524/m.86817 type:complete len:971 (-) Transcript_31524:8-2920(-)
MSPNVARQAAVILLIVAGLNITKATGLKAVRDWQGSHRNLGVPSRNGSRDAFFQQESLLLSTANQSASRETQGKPGVVQACEEATKVDALLSTEDIHRSCPARCPYYVEHRESLCTFSCVSARRCGELNPDTPFPNDALGICSRVALHGCEEIEWSFGTPARCAKCKSFYVSDSDDHCRFDSMHPVMWLFYILATVFLAVVGITVAWVVDLALRPIVNARVLESGLAHRSRVKLRMPKGQGSNVRKLFPLSTNLLDENVAGAGITLHFNFQLVVILWAFVVAISWTVIAAVVDSELFVLGTKSLGTPRSNCILVAQGHETQKNLMWVKVYFLAFVYFFTFLGSILFSVRQLRLSQRIDGSEKTMHDFAAKLENLPISCGADVEHHIATVVEEATNLCVVGVSVCWDFHNHEDTIAELIGPEFDNGDSDSAGIAPSLTSHLESQEGYGEGRFRGWRKKFMQAEAKLLWPSRGTPQEKEQPNAHDLLSSMRSSDSAFVVFHTEFDRDAAFEVFSTTPIEFRGKSLKMAKPIAEPNGVLWHNFTETSATNPISTWINKGVKGIGTWTLGLMVWAVVFYYPYYWSIANFDYDSGNQPGLIERLALTIVVVIGNNIMYNVCAAVSDGFGFEVKWKREACYMITYSIACVLNILLDFACTYIMVWERATSLGLRTHDGKQLSDIATVKNRLETYAVQRLLGENIFCYAVPSTFLVCFLIEPFATIFLPLQLTTFFVRSQKSVQSRDAENLHMCQDMDLGRYADIILNVFLSIFMFYFPAGYTHATFFWLALSHVYIYILDHCRVLRSVPQFCLASNKVDQCALVMLVPCCALILSALVFKSNCTGYVGSVCVPGHASAAAFVAHCVVHLLLLIYVVPKFGRPMSSVENKQTFADIARQVPCSWFSANPVHCLRSRYIHQHQPPCTYFIRGKGHLMQVNEAIGCYYQASAANDEAASEHIVAVATNWLTRYRGCLAA